MLAYDILSFLKINAYSSQSLKNLLFLEFDLFYEEAFLVILSIHLTKIPHYSWH